MYNVYIKYLLFRSLFITLGIFLLFIGWSVYYLASKNIDATSPYADRTAANPFYNISPQLSKHIGDLSYNSTNLILGTWPAVDGVIFGVITMGVGIVLIVISLTRWVFLPLLILDIIDKQVRAKSTRKVSNSNLILYLLLLITVALFAIIVTRNR